MMSSLCDASSPHDPREGPSAVEAQELDELLLRAREEARRLDSDPLETQRDRISLDDDDSVSHRGRHATASTFMERPLMVSDTTIQPKTDRQDAPSAKWNALPPPKLSKKQKAAARPHTAGPAWFDLPAPQPTPELKREIQAMRLTGALDPKHFQRGESRRERGKMPEFFQIGHLIDSPHPASTSASAPVARKRTFLETLVDDTEATAYAKKKYREVQARAASGGKNYYRAKMAARRRS